MIDQSLCYLAVGNLIYLLKLNKADSRYIPTIAFSYSLSICFVLCSDFLLSVGHTTPVEKLIGDSPSPCIVEMSEMLDGDHEMRDDWRCLWSELLDRELNEEVARQTKEGPTRFVLKLWCQKTSPSEATIEHLITALNAMRRNDVARAVEKYCKVRKECWRVNVQT